MKHILDRPVWSALTSRHAALAEGSDLARRYHPSTVPFAAARDDSAESLQALGELAGPDEALLLLQADPIVLPSGYLAEIMASGVQMVLQRTPPKVADTRIERLSEADAPEMLALATLTKPGPFSPKAQALGEFFGVKADGRLIAMAGERLKPAGYTEVSGVCTHPDFQGRGLGKLLSVFMTHRVLERDETPYLHAYATNAAAIGLYESIGFQLRTMMNVAVIRAVGAPPAPERALHPHPEN
jgi:GNAT superfamily N-acetyltransferase